MTFSIAKRSWAAAGCAAALMAAGAAHADTTWFVTGTFDDGGTLSGSFNINVYGFLAGFDLTTTAGTAAPGFEYTPSNSYFANGAFFIDAQPGYQGDLHLSFLDDLGIPSTGNPIRGGSPGPSYECFGSYSCYVPEGGTTRYIADGRATTGAVPEPAAWALMLTGFGGLGVMLRRARRQATPALTTA